MVTRLARMRLVHWAQQRPFATKKYELNAEERVDMLASLGARGWAQVRIASQRAAPCSLDNAFT